MTIKELLQKTYRDTPLETSEVDQILCLALHKNKEYLYKKPEKKLALTTIKSFYRLVKKRELGWPLAYLRGWQEFYALKFLVNKNTLIPRPDSELIIDAALDFLKEKNNLDILDIGTGSGCIIISLAKNNNKNNYFATDISKKALQIAQTNARKNQVKINFIHSDLFNKIPEKKFDLITANLPYLRPDQMQEKSIQKEPRSALLSGQDGLDHYSKLLSRVSK
jgi:release factor glutamine methyltransferase